MIKKAPNQVIRYCFEDGAHPYWPKKAPKPTEIPNCERCGARRQFEFQVNYSQLKYINSMVLGIATNTQLYRRRLI